MSESLHYQALYNFSNSSLLLAILSDKELSLFGLSVFPQLIKNKPTRIIEDFFIIKVSVIRLAANGSGLAEVGATEFLPFH